MRGPLTPIQQQQLLLQLLSQVQLLLQPQLLPQPQKRIMSISMIQRQELPPKEFPHIRIYSIPPLRPA